LVVAVELLQWQTVARMERAGARGVKASIRVVVKKRISELFLKWTGAMRVT